MEIDTVLEASKDFEKKGKREACHVLDQLLCHVAKTGETMIPWSQLKSYFLFKLEKVIDDFRASSPEQQRLVNPNVECVPFEDMKDRILKIVNGYNGIPFTIQRLCELLTDPKKNYTGTDKFLRGVEKNVMVVSCVCPTSEKNGVTSVNRMNGVMFPGNSSVYSDSRNMNGPGTPKPFGRPKLSPSTSPSTNGLPDCSDDKGASTGAGEGRASDSSESEGETPNSSVIKNKHPEEEDTVKADGHEVKRLKFDPDEGDGAESEGWGESSPADREESSSDAPGSSTDTVEEEGDDDKTDVVKRDGEPADAAASDDHEPTSTQTELLGGGDEEEEAEAGGTETEEREAAPGPAHSPQADAPTEPPRQPAQSEDSPSREEPADEEITDLVSSSGGGEEEEGTPGEEPEPAPASPGSIAESPADGAAEAQSSESRMTAAGEEAMEQD